MKEVGRNEPCPCGSGKKFKKCCLVLNSSDEMARKRSVDQLRVRVQVRESRRGIKDSLYLHEPKGVRKMSEIILEFAKPLLNDVDSFEDYREVILRATLAWNLSLMDESEGGAKLEKTCSKIAESYGVDVAAEFRQTIISLIRDKRQRYANIKRFVMDWEVIKLKDSFHLNVVSTIVDGDVDTEGLDKAIAKLVGAPHATVPAHA